MSRATFYTQRLLASIRRRDGYTIDGTPGDCVRAAVATVLGTTYDETPHFALYGRTWWTVMRLHARKYGLDWAAVEPSDLAKCVIPQRMLLIAAGPSPRGPWWHVVVTDHTGRMIHDPHPTRDGLASVAEFLVLVAPYDPPPQLLQLTTGEEPASNDRGPSRPLEGQP